ncbi:hypothetical protein [Ulvibacterium marinum]|uniref:Uncharacterized protein n=1 Tax=Ulvibacterium marinum TaxID=2419782 RepID=A0A3B0BYA7_9FLAO|nr:hypothetical protein [Ulvibacterium marinum]RKN78052.1 hypothetical protein D7Z94_22855 [Ulvibacterium marinum]
MMDELELLKKDWQKKGAELPKLSFDEIQNMLWKKSSSIVRWILIISVLEISLPQLLFLFPSIRNSMALLDNSTFNLGLLILSIFYYAVVVYFIYLFYKRYREISVLENAKTLMDKIILTRKTAFYYIIFSLSMFFVFFLYYALEMYFVDDVLMSIDGFEEVLKKRTLEEIRTMVFWGVILGGFFFTLVMGGIYFLLYGILLRKLKKNYQELKRLEI